MQHNYPDKYFFAISLSARPLPFMTVVAPSGEFDDSVPKIPVRTIRTTWPFTATGDLSTSRATYLVQPSADRVVGWKTYQRADQGRWGDGDSGDCDPYWPAEKGQVATTQSADGYTCQLRSRPMVRKEYRLSVRSKASPENLADHARSLGRFGEWNGSNCYSFAKPPSASPLCQFSCTPLDNLLTSFRVNWWRFFATILMTLLATGWRAILSSSMKTLILNPICANIGKVVHNVQLDKLQGGNLNL